MRAPGSSGGVHVELDDGVAIVTIDRPEVRNALGFATVDELDAALDQLADGDAAVVVLRGAGEHAFVSGGDLNELSTVRTRDEAIAMAIRVRRVLDKLATFPAPVIAALNGHALGGGAEVAIAADLRVAADDVKLGFTQATLGIMPAWGGAERLAQVIGRGRALLALSTGDLYDAAEAARIGLIDIVVPRERFDSEWRALARRLAEGAPGITRAVKAVVGAATPASHPHLEADATAAFAALWVTEAHWSAVERVRRKPKPSTPDPPTPDLPTPDPPT